MLRPGGGTVGQGGERDGDELEDALRLDGALAACRMSGSLRRACARRPLSRSCISMLDKIVISVHNGTEHFIPFQRTRRR